MTDTSKTPADRTRRSLLATGGGALAALGTLGTAHAAGRPATPTYAIARSRYTTAADANLPTSGDMYVLPLAAVVATDGKGESTLNADNTVRINTAGTYRVLLSVSWPAGKGHDVALRSWGIRRRAAGLQALTSIAGGALTKVPDTDEHLASQDLPGSATPPAVRFPAPPDGAHSDPTPFPWTPGTIAAGGTASIDVTMPVSGIVAAGDLAVASLTSITDTALGAAAASSLVVRAVVVAADKVRVTLLNTLTTTVTVPQGDLYVLGWNATMLRGGSGNAQTMLQSSILKLAAGDTVYAVFGSLCPGDLMPAGAEVYLQVEQWKQTS